MVISSVLLPGSFARPSAGCPRCLGKGVSFHNVNMALSNRTNLPPDKPWPHKDQDSDRKKSGSSRHAELVNIFPQGDNDSGLT